MAISLSVFIICQNEAQDIAACLDTVSWADEIVVVDSGSTDGSQAICLSYGAKLIETNDWPGFGIQKNRALAECQHEWVLSLDADERITAELKDEIISVISQANPILGYEIPRQSFFCEKPIRYSGWKPDYVLRLFKKEAGSFTNVRVHERVILNPITKIGRLNHHMLHYTYRTLNEFHSKVVKYSEAGAQDLIHRGKKVCFMDAITHGVWAFIRTYFLKLGLLDGKEGVLIALGNAESSFYKYAKASFKNASKKV